MNIKITLIIILSGIAIQLPAQNEMFTDAYNEFNTSKLWEYEEVSVTWRMEGIIQAELNEGLNNLLEQKAGLAESNFTIVLEKDPTIWEAYYYRAAARKQLKKFGTAERDLRQALKLHGDFYEGYVELAKVLYLDFQIDESEHAINRAVRLDKSKGTAYYLKGDIRLAQGLPQLAINNYKDCLASDSLFHNARIKLALLEFVNKKDVSRMLNHLGTVLSYDSLQKTALLFRSILLFEKDKKQSVQDLTNLVKVSPFNYMAYYYRGLCLAELGDYYRAFSDFQKVIKATSTDENNFKGQQTWLDKKIDIQNAGAYMLTRVYGIPEGDGLKLKEAYCHILTGAFDKSIAVIDQVARHNEEPLAVYLKAVAHEHKGDHIQAYQFYNFALTLDNEIADAHKKRGIYEQELKEWDRSIADLTEVLRLLPQSFAIHRIRGISYFHNQQFPEAIADFTAYLKYDSINKEVIASRGMAFLKDNQRLRAYTDFAVSGHYNMLKFQDMEKLIDSVMVSDTTQALFYLDKITDAAPYFTEGYVQKFKIHIARDEWKPIEKNILKAVRNSRVEVNKSTHSYLLTVQAINLARLKHEEDAVDKFTEAIKFDDANDIAYMERSKLLLAVGKTSRARNDLKKAASLGNMEAVKILDTLPR